MKKWLVLVVVSVSVWMLSAQTPTEGIWLYSTENQQLLHVDMRGDVLSVHPLPTFSGLALRYPLMAYTDNRLLTLYSLEQAQIRATFPLSSPQIGTNNNDDVLKLSQMAFDSAANFMAYSTFLGGEGWTINIINTRTLTEIARLEWQDALVEPFATVLHAGTLPSIEAVFSTGEQVTAVHFAIKNPFGTPAPAQRSFVWSVASDSLNETVRYPRSGATLLERDENVFAQSDARFPAINPTYTRVPYLQNNTLTIAQGEQRAPFYTMDTLNIERVLFIQGGERLLFEAQVPDSADVWVVVSREGAEIRRFRRNSADVVGVRDGFVYLTQADGNSALVMVDTRNSGGAVPFWSSSGAWQIITSDMRASADIPTWALLAEPMLNPVFSSASTPTLYPTPSPILRVGLTVYIQTLPNEFLNLRSEPSLQGDVLVLLENNVEAIIIDGVVEADGFRWWKIRLRNREGWVVEEVAGVASVVTIPNVRTPTPTPSPTP
jgi:hypothetical protein